MSHKAGSIGPWRMVAVRADLYAAHRVLANGDREVLSIEAHCIACAGMTALRQSPGPMHMIGGRLSTSCRERLRSCILAYREDGLEALLLMLAPPLGPLYEQGTKSPENPT